MQLRPDVLLAGTIKSLRDVVAPALDPANTLAHEQLAVSIGLLELLRARLPLEFRFDLDELARLLAFARALSAYEDIAGARSCVEALRVAARAGEDVLARAGAAPAEALAAVTELRARSGAAVTALFEEGNEELRRALTRDTLAYSREQLLRDRAWTAPQGWEAHADALPSIESLLAPAMPAASRET